MEEQDHTFYLSIHNTTKPLTSFNLKPARFHKQIPFSCGLDRYELIRKNVHIISQSIFTCAFSHSLGFERRQLYIDMPDSATMRTLYLEDLEGFDLEDNFWLVQWPYLFVLRSSKEKGLMVTNVESGQLVFEVTLCILLMF